MAVRIISNKTSTDRLLNRVFTSSVRTGYVEVGEDNVCLSINYKDYADQITNFKIYDDDVILTGFPKSGTTWCQEMLWLLVHDLDYEGAKVPSYQRYRMLEMATLYDLKLMKSDGIDLGDPLEFLKSMERPRCMKTHLNWSLLPEEIKNGSKCPKIINIRRNPKDTCVSHFHQARLAAGFKGTFDEFCELYLAGRVPYGPYWKYVLSFWQQRHRPNILFIKYEDMVSDLSSVIVKVASFLNKLVTDQDIEKLKLHLSFESMKKNPAVNYNKTSEEMIAKYNLNTGGTHFYREGKVGNFKTVMSSEMEERFNAWIEDNISSTDFKL